MGHRPERSFWFRDGLAFLGQLTCRAISALYQLAETMTYALPAPSLPSRPLVRLPLRIHHATPRPRLCHRCRREYQPEGRSTSKAGAVA